MTDAELVWGSYDPPAGGTRPTDPDGATPGAGDWRTNPITPQPPTPDPNPTPRVGVGLYTQASTIISRTLTGESDRYGNPIPGTPRRTPMGCWYTTQTSSSDTDGREQSETIYLAQWPAQAWPVLAACDSVELPIGTFRLIGDPIYQPGGLLLDDYVQARLQRWTG